MATSHRYPIGCTLGLILACQALAEPPSAAPSNGIMTFPNVRVVHAPPAMEQQPAADAASVQAFIDPITGELTAATPEQAKQLSNAMAARARTRTLTSSSTTANSDESAQLIYGPGNTVGLRLGEEDMISLKAQVDSDGNLVQECVTESSAAHAADIHTQPSSSREESHNDR